jgi:hypothetical protein
MGSQTGLGATVGAGHLLTVSRVGQEEMGAGDHQVWPD